MAVLVTGGAGYIGTHMVLELLDAGEQAVVVDDLSTGFDWAVPERADLIVGDISDRALVSRLISDRGIDSIIHFAAKTIVPDSVAAPLAYYESNFAKTRSLVETAVESGVSNFIFSSTAAVYGEGSAGPVSEEQLPSPVSPYGRSKLMVEWMLDDVSRAHGLRCASLRYFNVAGADPNGRAGQSTSHATHLIKVAVQAALGLRAGMDVFGLDYPTSDGSCIRDFIQVSDLARAHMAALRHLRAGGENLTCNCGYARGHSVLEVIAAAKEISGVDFPVKICERRPGDAASVVAANKRLIEQLAWRPRYDDLSTIVQQAFEWERLLARKTHEGASILSPTAA